MSDYYLGATQSELFYAPFSRRLLGCATQRALFPHEGQLLLTPRELVLYNWLVIPRAAVTRVDLMFTGAYTRAQAGGIRGNASSFGLFGSLGKPLIIGISGSEPVYLLINFRFFTGINDARRWAPWLRNWVRQEVPTQ